jgi:UPF0716 protein FxsA
MGRLFLMAALTAVAEVVVFVVVGQWLGWAWTVLLVLAASLAGGVLLHRESIEAWRRLRDVAQTGRPPGRQVIDGLVGLVGALLLAVPGLLTGLAGALLLIPPLRRLAGRQAERRAERRLSAATAGDLFGPRRVRVWRGEPQADGPAGGVSNGAAGRPVPGETIEGEILGPPPGDRGGAPGRAPDER